MKVTGTDGKEYTVEPDANLRDANSSGADLSDADLSDADLWRANLRDTNLRDTNLRDTNLSDANLKGANLSKSIDGRSDGTLCAFSYTVGHFEIQLSSIFQKNTPILLTSLLMLGYDNVSFSFLISFPLPRPSAKLLIDTR